MKVGDKVYDTWWPWSLGKITKISNKYTYVRWSSGPLEGSNQKYDKDHLKFLKVQK